MQYAQVFQGLDVDGDGRDEILVRLTERRSDHASSGEIFLLKREGEALSSRALSPLDPSGSWIGSRWISSLRPPGHERDFAVTTRGATLVVFDVNEVATQCVLADETGARAAVVNDMGTIFDIGDFDGDGGIDLLAGLTCAGCESNHLLYRGTRPADRLPQAK